MDSRIAINNAGLVLINIYIPLLFERLGLTNNNEFINKRNQFDAVQYLQYLAAGISNDDESLLPLNKIFCGLPITDPVITHVTITQENIELINGLIKATISHWPAIGESSIEGFRGNWLMRDGILIEHESRWELIIEKRPYDILIQKSPYSFSIIKFPWMQNSIHVNWPY